MMTNTPTHAHVAATAHSPWQWPRGSVPVAVVDAFEEAWGMTKADCPPYWSGWSGQETEKPAHARL